MENWQEKFLKIVSEMEAEIDQQKFKLKSKLDLLDPVTIQPYRGFAGKNGLFLRGRVLENEGINLPPRDASVWKNIRSLFYRFESDEIPEAPIEITFNNFSQKLKCDREGFFELKVQKEKMPELDKGKWQKINLRLLKQYNKEQKEVKVEGELLLQQEKNSYGVISDVDDTIIVTKATDFLEKMRIFMLRNSHTRKPLEGVAAFYQALEGGKEKNCQNPIFYVSSSSWNLYDVLDNFCRINEIPKGSFLFQELGVNREKFIREGHSHKLNKIKHVLDNFSDLPFVLIGDSGQKDPEMYKEIVEQYPRRIKAIYIRDVYPETSDKREKEVQQIAAEIAEKGVEMKLIQDSIEAGKHAVELGLIPEESLKKIENETHEDRKRLSSISNLLGLD